MSIANLSQNAEITQSGQALRINLSAYNGLSRLFQSSFGPKGTSKMLINNQSVKILKDGRSLIDSILFTHPVVNLINKSARQSHELLGDGVSTFILFGNYLFNESVKDCQSVVRANEQIMTDLYKMKELLEKKKIEFNFEQEMAKSKEIATESTQNTEESSVLLRIIYSFLNTKMDETLADFFSKIVINSFSQNIQMTEILVLDGDIFDSCVVDGLVLDHSGRHPSMPKFVENCFIMVSNMSLEYEKTEINSQLVFKNVEERKVMVQSERAILNRKIDKILKLKEQVEKQGKKLVILTERGIDLPSLDRLSSVLCLRRVKRKNLERLLRLCGGKIVTTEEDIKLASLGYTGKVYVQEAQDKSYTFVTNTPYTGAKTVLLSGHNQYEKERIRLSIVAAFKILQNLKQHPFYLQGGALLYKSLYKEIEEINGGRSAVSESLFKMYQLLSKSENENILDSFVTVERTLFNSGTVTSTLLLVDEIIKAGKSVKEEPQEPKA